MIKNLSADELCQVMALINNSSVSHLYSDLYEHVKALSVQQLEVERLERLRGKDND